MSRCFHAARIIVVLGLSALLPQLAGAVVHDRTATQIPMRDGRSLAADVYRPSGASGSWPTILIQTPYNKNLFMSVFLFEVSQDPLLKSSDYAFVVLDWRGFFASGGAAYSGAPTRGQDGADAVQWIAAQPWSNGSVGAWGASALGTAQLQTALEKPAALKACVPIVCRLGETYDGWFPGGVYFKNRNDFVTQTFYGGLPIFRNQPLYNTFWSAREAQRGDYSGVSTPMLFVSGWYDHQTNATLEEFARVRAAQGGALSPTRALIGPWSHSAIGKASQGELSYPAASHADSTAALAFFDEHLRGIAPASPGPTVRWFLMNEDTWQDSQAWPPPQAQHLQTFYLRQDRSLSSNPETASAAPSQLLLQSSPASPLPTTAGALLHPPEGQVQGPGDLSPLLTRPDVCLLQTQPLAAAVRLAGNHEAHLWIQCDAPDVDVVVRLLHIRPDAKAMLLADGIRRASLRNGFSVRQLLSPGTPVEVPVSLPPLGATIPEGHRLGIAVALSNYDLFEVNPQDGSNYPDSPGAVPRNASVALLTAPQFPSRLEVQTLPPFSAVADWSIY